MNHPRTALASAIDARLSAEDRLRAAHEATQRAAEYVKAAKAEVKKQADFAKGATLAQAVAMREAIKSGKAPVIEGAPKLAEYSAARLEAP